MKIYNVKMVKTEMQSWLLYIRWYREEDRVTAGAILQPVEPPPPSLIVNICNIAAWKEVIHITVAL